MRLCPEPLPPPSGKREQKRLELRGLQNLDWSKWKRLDKMTTAHPKRAELTNHRAHCNRPSVSERKQNNKRHLAFTEWAIFSFSQILFVVCSSMFVWVAHVAILPQQTTMSCEAVWWIWDLSFGRIWVLVTPTNSTVFFGGLFCVWCVGVRCCAVA